MSLLDFIMITAALCFAAALASCSGVSGSVYLTDPDHGAKAGLDYQDGQARAFARKDWRDPETGELIARTQIEKRILSDK